MNTTPDRTTESRIAAGIKTAAVVAVLGLIAVAAHPQRVSDEAVIRSAAATTTATAAPRLDGVAGEDYYDSHYPAPTRVEDQPPTF